jgi:site-specific recombinase XerD
LIPDIEVLFPEYLRECRFLKNLSLRTIQSYEHCFRMIRPFVDAKDGDWKQALMDFAATGRRNPGGVNIIVRSMKPFVKWLHENGHVQAPIVLKKQKGPAVIMPTLSAEEVVKLVRYRPHDGRGRRAHLAALTILDTGLRSAECLDLRTEDVDLDHQLIQVMGKGSRERTVPISLEMRRRLYPWMRALPTGSVYLLPNRNAGPVDYCNALHDLYEIGEDLGLKLRFHLLRHTFATNYIRQGGDLARLQRILGHSSITTTMKYVHLQTEDLQRDHEKYSILSRSK